MNERGNNKRTTDLILITIILSIFGFLIFQYAQKRDVENEGKQGVSIAESVIKDRLAKLQEVRAEEEAQAELEEAQAEKEIELKEFSGDYIAINKTKLKGEPSIDSKVIDEYKKGTEIKVIEKTTKEIDGVIWYRVEVDNKEGFMQSTNLDKYVKEKTVAKDEIIGCLSNIFIENWIFKGKRWS